MKTAAGLMAAALVLVGCQGPQDATCHDIDQAVLAADDTAAMGRWMDEALAAARRDLPKDDRLRADLEWLKSQGGGSYLSVVTLQANHCS